MFIGIGLSPFGLIDSLSLYRVYGILLALCLVVLWRKHRLTRPNWTRSFSRENLAGGIIIVVPYIMALVLWYPYFGFHASDPGLHDFWGEWIVTTHSLPNYAVTGPSLPSVLFVFGPHLLLAAVSLLSQVPVSNVMPFMLLYFYFAILLAVQAITKTITQSRLACFLASLFYVASQIPAARVLLGNLPDMIGYFLLASTILSLMGGQELRSVILSSLIASSIVAYYQYALITEILVLIIASVILFFSLVTKERISIRVSWKRIMLPISVAACELALVIPNIFYLNLSSVSILKATTYAPLVVSDYSRNLGNPYLLFVGGAGLVYLLLTISMRGSAKGVLVVAWCLGLVVASVGPRLGFGVEPIRFVWHLVEPLAIAGGALLAAVIRTLFGQSSRTFRVLGFSAGISFTSNRIRSVFAGIGILLLVMTTIFLPSAQYWSSRQVAAQPYYQDDMIVGDWLSTNANMSAGIVVNSNVDNSATWVQAFSQKPRFFYAVSSAVPVAAPQFSVIYRDMNAVFENPGSPSVIGTLANYDISFVIADGPQILSFMNSPFFFERFRSGNVAVFSPLQVSNYGFATMNGYLVTTGSGRLAVITSRVQIELTLTSPSNYSLPFHGQLVDPPAVQSAFSVIVDGNILGNYSCSSGPSIDTNLGLPKLFPSLRSSNVSLPVDVDLSLATGDHRVVLMSTSAVLFEVYLDDLAKLRIGVDTSNLTLVNP